MEATFLNHFLYEIDYLKIGALVIGVFMIKSQKVEFNTESVVSRNHSDHLQKKVWF